jgi:2-amino-4-hydroxy-6-hydroxymethyldihydropteridine diphosphokinase
VSAGKTTQAFIGFGSNLGNGRQLILSAWNRLAVEKQVAPRQLSSLYVTEAVGMTSRSLFTNGVGMVETELKPLELLHLLLQVETEHGRQRDIHASGYQDRILDLDLLYFGDTVSSSPELLLPHPHIASRLFVLAPLAQIAPWFQDPLTGQTVDVLYQQLLMQIQQGKVPAQGISRIEHAM